MKLLTVKEAAEVIGKSERSVWRYVQRLEAAGQAVSYRRPGSQDTLVDLDKVQAMSAVQLRGNPSHRRGVTR